MDETMKKKVTGTGQDKVEGIDDKNCVIAEHYE